MSKFVLRSIKEIKGRISFFHLEMDGIIQFEEFEKELLEQGHYESELRTMQTRMQQMAEMKLLPKTKCRDITPKGAKNKEYELKTANLRCYLFHEESKGRIVVLLAKKKPKVQSKDIKKFRRLKDQYLSYISDAK